MSLFAQTLNPKSTLPDMFMVHGWAMHSALWGDFAQSLCAHWRVSVVDLPGHGDSHAAAFLGDLDAWANALLAVAPEKSVWLGWSMGGLIAQRAAILMPERMTGLGLIASTPCFTRRADWPHAVDAVVFKQFAVNLAAKFESTLLRFLSLQIRGSDQATKTLKHLKRGLNMKPAADPRALDMGLGLLLDSDLRDQWPDIQCPIVAVFGAVDTLVPKAVAEDIARLGESVYIQVLKTAGHAPFMTHRQAVVEAMSRLEVT